MNIGLKIRELRKRKGITQERLAEYLNISPQAVSKWESGMSLPDITYVPKLAIFFGVSTDVLFAMSEDSGDNQRAEYKRQIRELKNTKMDYVRVLFSSIASFVTLFALTKIMGYKQMSQLSMEAANRLIYALYSICTVPCPSGIGSFVTRGSIIISSPES